MRFYKLRVTPNAANVATTFNEQFQPETIPEHNDPYQPEWIDDGPDVLVGEQVMRPPFTEVLNAERNRRSA